MLNTSASPTPSQLKLFAAADLLFEAAVLMIEEKTAEGADIIPALHSAIARISPAHIFAATRICKSAPPEVVEYVYDTLEEVHTVLLPRALRHARTGGADNDA